MLLGLPANVVVYSLYLEISPFQLHCASTKYGQPLSKGDCGLSNGLTFLLIQCSKKKETFSPKAWPEIP